MENIYNDIYDNKIRPLFDLILTQLNAIGDEIFKYQSRICFKDLFYIILCANTSNNASYSKAINDAVTDEILKVSKSAIIQKRQKCESSHFKQLNDKILEFIYSDTVTRILGTDGTFVYTVISLANEGITKSNNNNSCKVLVNVIYDVERKIPISYREIDEKDERSLLKNQFSELKKGDIVIHDGGYYSIELLKKYMDNKINAIFRINKKNEKLFKKNENDIILPINKVYRKKSKRFNKKQIQARLECPKARYIKFYADIGKGKKTFYLCTTLMNYTTEEIVDMYRKRWKIETYFKSGKEDISLNNIKSKSVNNVKQDIHINHFISIVSSYIEYLLTPLLKKSLNSSTHYCKINTRSCICLVSSKLIRAMFFDKYKNESKNLFNNIAESLIKSYILIKKYRSFERVRKRPQGKWSITGTSSHRPIKGERIPVIKTNNGICIPKIECGIKNNETTNTIRINHSTTETNININKSIT